MRDLRLARIYFFVFIGAIGFYAPFLNIFYREQGLSGAEIGLVVTVGSLVGLFVSPLWGRWSDSGASLTRLLQLGLISTGVLLLVLSRQNLFATVAIVIGIIGVSSSGLLPLSDALALRISQARRTGYGSIRVFGSAGWAVVVFGAGFLFEITGVVAGFYGGAIMMAASAVLLLFIPLSDTQAAAAPRPRERSGLTNALRTVWHTRALLGLLLALIVRGILSDGHLQFGNIYLEQLGAATWIIGIASMLQAAVELPCFVLADRVVRRVGATRILLLSFFITGGKLMLVLVYPAVPIILVTRAIEGLAFSFFTIGLMNYITGRAPSAQMATMLALFTVTLTAFIQILGAPIGGVVFDAVGAYWLYALALVGNLAAVAILFVFTRGEGKAQKSETVL